MWEITLPIRRLVEFIMRSGSIDARLGGGFDRAQEGSRIHRRLQKEGGAAYQAEVPLTITAECGGFCYTVHGRADGILTEEDRTVIDEIKTTTLPIDRVTENQNPAHWAQACCYGYILCEQAQLEQVTIRLTYVQTDSGEVRRFFRTYTRTQLTVSFFELLQKYERWARLACTEQDARNRSLQQLTFPFPRYRAGQRELAVAVYRTIASGGRLFCSAPTGIGKTISTIFPALKAMGEGMGEKIFYLTAKTVTGRAAEDALDQLHAHDPDLQLRSITLTAKDKMCKLEERLCIPEACPFAKGYFDRVNDAVYDILTHETVLDRESIQRAADKYMLCPYELSLDLSLWCDCIICDYNYLMDPVVHLQRFFESRSDYIFLLDEAHNAIDRCRDMFSATLRKSDVLALRKQIPKNHRSLRGAVTKLNNALLDLRTECEESGAHRMIRKQFPESLHTPLHLFITAAGNWLEEYRGMYPELEKQLLTVFFDVRFFARIAEQFDDTYAVLMMHRRSELVIRLLCLDPAPQVHDALCKGRSAVFFSATLSPLDYYREVLGGGEDSRTLGLGSPFPPENLGLYIADGVSTRYTDRAESEELIVELLVTMTSAKKGHYIAYFPSYTYMEQILDRFTALYPEIPVLRQERNMTEEERSAFLRRFDSDDGAPLLGFCVLGGLYAEGVDLTGDRLIGTAIIGVGLPQLGPEPNLLKEYYNEKDGNGFDYAYRFPGMNKVLQAAGRVIRTEQDRGVVLLIDDRFSAPAYRGLFPAHWQHGKSVTLQSLPGELAAFWKETS